MTHESCHALVTTRAPLAVNQILPDSHRVPATLQLQRDQFTVRFAVARRPQPGFQAKKPVITSIAGFESPPSESVIGFTAAFEGR